MSENIWLLIIDAALAGQCALLVSQLLLTGWSKPWHFPLILMFASAFIIQAIAVMVFLESPVLALAVCLEVPAHFLFIGALRLYTEAITSAYPERKSQHYARYLWPVPLALIVTIPFFLLPADIRSALALTGDIQGSEGFHAAVPIVLSEVFWVFWAVPNLYLILRELSRFRLQLREIHSSTEQRELVWVSILVGVLVLYWAVSLVGIFSYVGLGVELPGYFENSIYILVIWIPALWGLRQIPALQDDNWPQTTNLIQSDSKELDKKKTKYERSALGAEQIDRIAQKIEYAMETDRLFRDPNLSLGGLASHLVVSTNYLSQSLNTSFQESFFEYVNRWRTVDAEKSLREPGRTVMDIAYESGFNSRSSFYNAFKRHYDCTPAVYRKKFQKNFLQNKNI